MRQAARRKRRASRGADRGMRFPVTPRGALALLAVPAVAVAGCDINVKESSKHPAGVGDPLVLKGDDAKTKITPTQVIDPLRVGIPKSETRYVGIDLKVENVGKSTTAGSLD